MSYCVNCGAQNEEGARFCASCGKPVIGAVQGGPQPKPAYQQPVGASTVTGTSNTMLLAAMGAYALAAVLVLLGGNMLGLITSLLMIVLIYYLAHVPLGKGDANAATNGAAIAAGVSLLFGFINLMLGDAFAAIFVFLIAAILGIAWNQIKR